MELCLDGSPWKWVGRREIDKWGVPIELHEQMVKNQGKGAITMAKSEQYLFIHSNVVNNSFAIVTQAITELDLDTHRRNRLLSSHKPEKFTSAK
jgi:hypothetical protein